MSPGLGGRPATIASELVPGALAPVKWEPAFIGSCHGGNTHTTYWRAIPPTSDYIALGCVASMTPASSSNPTQPPDSIARRFRAVHKRAITAAKNGVTTSWKYYNYPQDVVYIIDGRYVHGDTALPHKSDCYILDPKNTVEESSFRA